MARDQESRTFRQPPDSNCDDLTSAALEVEEKLSRMQDAITEMCTPEGDTQEITGELIAELDVAPEIDDLREALGMDESGSRAGSFEDRKKQDLPAAAARVRAKHNRRRGRPADAPTEDDTWRSGPSRQAS
jgi:hypothetical protein